MAAGGHGGAMVPLWSRVRLIGHAHGRAKLQASLDALRAEAAPQPLAERVAALRETVSREFHTGRVAAAYEATSQALADDCRRKRPARAASQWAGSAGRRFDHVEQAMIRDSVDAIARSVAGIASPA